MKVMITGGTGFIGSNLAKGLVAKGTRRDRLRYEPDARESRGDPR